MILSSMLVRIAVAWPEAISRLFRLQSFLGNNVEVYSIDCSIEVAADHSKVRPPPGRPATTL